MATSDTLRRTPLHDRHVAAGARLVPFAGWEMPVQYEGIRPEHAAVRGHAGVFDVSHMGQVETRGPDAATFLQRVLSNDVSRIVPGGAQYSVLCRENGGVLDDLFTYRLADDRYLTVTNAANHARDHAWLAEHAEGFDVEVRDVFDDYAMIALQGPDARAILARHLSDGEAPARMRVAEARVAGAQALVCGTGYTGEDGVELLVAPADAPGVWDALVADGARPVGLGARDTLRLEVCFHLYGNDLSEDRNPIEAGLGWACKLDTAFIGADALRDLDPPERLVPLAAVGEGIPRPGYPVRLAGTDADAGAEGEAEVVGTVTSGTYSPSLERGIAFAYVRAELAAPGTLVDVDVRGRLRRSEVREKPLYRKEA